MQFIIQNSRVEYCELQGGKKLYLAMAQEQFQPDVKGLGLGLRWH